MRFIVNAFSVLATVKLGYNGHSIITNRFLSQIGHLSTQINPLVMNSGYNEENVQV